MRIKFQFILIFLMFNGIMAGENTEFRAVWVITWEHISASSSAETNKARVRQILDNVKKANMNAVLWQVRQSGTAYYNSSYEPWGYYAGYSNPGYDPLAYAIEEAHKRGLELHAWFNVFHTADMVNGAPAYEHPDWVCRDGYGEPMPASRALSPGIKAVRDYTIDVAMEIVRNYDIDGLHLDYVRWNEYYRSSFSSPSFQKEKEISQLDGMITPEHLQQLNEVASQERYLYDVEHPYSSGVPAGFGSWEDWWRWSVTEFVKTLHDSIQSVKPWVRLTPAALGKYNWSSWQGYGTVYQDAAMWFNQGFVDQLTPMHYHWTTGSEFYAMLQGNPSESWGPWIQDGVNAGRLFTVGPGSYRLSSDNVWDNHPQIIKHSRDVAWVDGFQFFSYGSWKNHNYWEEAKSLFFNKITKIRPAKFLRDDTPPAPVITLNKINDQNYQIDVSPDEILDIDQWFAIYRSEDNVLDPDSDEIITIRFGRVDFSFADSISGLQDFNGKYTYFATRFDRYWNESLLSNSVVSDSVPSFAPVVIQTNPAPGDTVPVNFHIELIFSKTMDTTGFQNHVSFEPSVAISAINWSSDLKQVTIVPAASFENDTEYTLRVVKEATDINGKQLDGNADGGDSEDFVLVFRTTELDVFPPRLVYSNPASDIYVDNFDVQDIFAFAFDELLDHASVQSTSVSLTWEGQEIAHKSMVYDVDGKSVVGVQTEEPLYSGHSFQITLSGYVTDTSGNALNLPIAIDFETAPLSYQEIKLIDNMSGTGNWRDPGYSGSTNGIDPVASTFNYSSTVYLPGVTKPLDKKSARLHYLWDANALDPPGSQYLLREYLDESPPRNVVFGTDYILQCYIFGDGSLNKFRFALDEGNGSSWPNHEVSKWFTIDWTGWKLVEWDLSNPDMVGTWIGNGVLDMSSYRIDSFQLTHDDENGAESGTLYFSNLRVVKKQSEVTNISGEMITGLPEKFDLEQNYPNPFNPVTTIPFAITQPGKVHLAIYNVLGQEVEVLIDNNMQPGRYEWQFDAGQLASGIYIYELRTTEATRRKRMILLK